MEDENFGWTVEMQIKAAIASLRTVELPVPYRKRIGVSKISGTISGTFRAGYKILWTIGKYAWLMRGWNPSPMVESRAVSRNAATVESTPPNEAVSSN